MAIRVTGMYSGLDTESIISELVSAKSIKKQKLVKSQTKLSWKQDAWKALNTKIYSFYSNFLDNLRYQGSYKKKTTKVSSSAITVSTSDSAVDGVRSVKVNQLAKGANLTSGDLTSKDGVKFTGYASLAQLRKYSELDNDANLSGSFRIMGEQGQYFDFEVNENTTINDIVDMIKSTGLNCNYDADSQRIFISSKNTGAANNFYIMANDEGGFNALAALQLLSADDVKNNKELQKWADYSKTENKAAYDQLVQDEIEARKAAYQAEKDKLTDRNDKLDAENTDLQKAINDIINNMTGWASDAYNTGYAADHGGKTMQQAAEDLYKDGGLYDQMRKKKADLDAVLSNESATDDEKEAAQTAYDNAKEAYEKAEKDLFGYIDDIVYGPMEQLKDDDGNLLYEKKVKEGSDGEPEKDEDGNIVYEDDLDKPKMARNTDKSLKAQYEAAAAEGDVPADLKAKVDSINNWYDAVASFKEDKEKLETNKAEIEKNKAQIDVDDSYLSDDTTIPGYNGMTKLQYEIEQEFQTRIKTAQDTLAAVAGDSKLLTASKVNAQDAEIEIDGAKFTSMTNQFSVNGLTLTANEVTDGKEITITTSTDTDGIYDMIKNFITEYNSLINEMNSLYNADSSKGYEPLTSEEKEAMSESEIEEWEKKIKDSLLRRDSTLSSVSNSMISVLLQGAVVNGRQMYLSDFGISTLGYFEAKDNERNAYHIDGDADDDATKGNTNVLKNMIAKDPDTVMHFFTKLANNLYDNLTEQMASSTMSSAFTVYNDKQMKSEYDSYKEKIAKEEEKLNALMDKWYSKFSKMEVALSKLESRSNSLAGILGG